MRRILGPRPLCPLRLRAEHLGATHPASSRPQTPHLAPQLPLRSLRPPGPIHGLQWALGLLPPQGLNFRPPPAGEGGAGSEAEAQGRLVPLGRLAPPVLSPGGASLRALLSSAAAWGRGPPGPPGPGQRGAHRVAHPAVCRLLTSLLLQRPTPASLMPVPRPLRKPLFPPCSHPHSFHPVPVPLLSVLSE